MTLKRWPNPWPWQCAGMLLHKFPNGGGLGLSKMPLNATIGQALQPIMTIGHACAVFFDVFIVKTVDKGCRSTLRPLLSIKVLHIKQKRRAQLRWVYNLLGGSNYKNNIWTRGFAIAFVLTVAMFETQYRSPGENSEFCYVFRVFDPPTRAPYWVEEQLFYIDTMARTVSGPSQATVHPARKTPQDLYYECLNEGEAWQFSIPRLLYKIDMQARIAAARATVLQYTSSRPIFKKIYSPYSNSDDDSDGPPPSPKRTDATEMKIDESLQIFINALPHLDPLHFGFKL